MEDLEDDDDISDPDVPDHPDEKINAVLDSDDRHIKKRLCPCDSESDDSDERILVVWYGYVCIGIYKIEDDQYIKIA